MTRRLGRGLGDLKPTGGAEAVDRVAGRDVVTVHHVEQLITVTLPPGMLETLVGHSPQCGLPFTEPCWYCARNRDEQGMVAPALLLPDPNTGENSPSGQLARS